MKDFKQPSVLIDVPITTSGSTESEGRMRSALTEKDLNEAYQEQIEFERECVRACTTLENPVDDIRELVLAARDFLFDCTREETETKLRSILSKFEGVK